LHHKDRTNTALLSETILVLAHEQEFFIRKAIGWVLRQYARTDPRWVTHFVAEHERVLSPLSRREAMKHLE
jgi:3-methyladenine DNA glycosylase AlkD